MIRDLFSWAPEPFNLRVAGLRCAGSSSLVLRWAGLRLRLFAFELCARFFEDIFENPSGREISVRCFSIKVRKGVRNRVSGCIRYRITGLRYRFSLKERNKSV